MTKSHKPHFNEDDLLKYALELLDSSEEKIIAEHLSECLKCSQALDSIEHDVKVMQEIPIPDNFSDIALPARYRISVAPYFRAAALLLIGFGFGLSFNYQSSNEHILMYSAVAEHSANDIETKVPTVCIGENLRVNYTAYQEH